MDLFILGIALKEERFAKGMTQMQLAEKSSLSANYISQVERGLKKVSLDVFIKLCFALEVKPQLILNVYFEQKESNNE